MPGVSAVPVSLTEVVEVRGGRGLNDAEIWSLVHDLSGRLQKLVDVGAAPADVTCAAGCSSDGIYVYADGTTAVQCVDIGDLPADARPPEADRTQATGAFDPVAVSDLVHEILSITIF